MNVTTGGIELMLARSFEYIESGKRLISTIGRKMLWLVN